MATAIPALLDHGAMSDRPYSPIGRAQAMKLAASVIRPSHEYPHKQAVKACRNAMLAARRPDLFDDDMQQQRLAPLCEMLEGRTVAIVGNAASLLEGEAGAEIDQHDAVIRFNWGFIEQARSQGTKTSVHCLASNVPRDRIAAAWPSAEILFVSPLRFFLDPALRQTSMILPIRRWSRLLGMLGDNRPSAGLMTLDLLRDFRPRRLAVYGFDWKQSRTFYHKKSQTDWHGWNEERELVRHWMETDSRIVLHSS